MGTLVEGNNGTFTMPVQPMYGGGMGCGNGMGYGMGYGNEWWFLLVFLALIFNNGFGNNRGDNGGNGGNVLPYIISNGTNSDVQRGFDQQALVNGIGNVSSEICNLQNSIGGYFANAETAAANRQMADMNQWFNISTQMNNNANNLQSLISKCCCDDQLATAQLTSTILAENCADRTALADATRDIIGAVNNGTQRLLDTMCDYKIAAKDEKINELNTAILLSNINNNIRLQTEQINANNLAQTQALQQYIAPRAIPAYLTCNPNAAAYVGQPVNYGNSCCGNGTYYGNCA